MKFDYSPLWNQMERKNITKKELSEATGISVSLFSNAMKDGESITVRSLIKIADALQCGADEVVNMRVTNKCCLPNIINEHSDSGSALDDFSYWMEKTVRSNSKTAKLLSKLMDEDSGAFATSIKLNTECAGHNVIEVEYMDMCQGALKKDFIKINRSDAELICEGTYDDFSKAIFVGMNMTLLSSEQLAKTLYT